MSAYILVGVIVLLCIVSWVKKINAYDAFIEGCKEGILLFYSVFPSMLAMLFCVNLLRVSQLFEWITQLMIAINPNIDPAIIPMILFRPISGSASLAVLTQLYETTGVNSLASRMASVIQGSTDTTFYVITLYFSSVGIKKIKHVIPVSLAADIIAIVLAIYFTIYYFHS